MSNPPVRFHQLVSVNTAFKPSVQLPGDFEDDAINEQLIRSYIPTTQTIELFAQIARSLKSNNTDRVRSLVGTYGTGKSDLLLMLCNYFSRPVDDSLMQPFYQKLHSIDEAQYEVIYQNRANRKPYLVVLLQPDTRTMFQGFVIYGLERALARAKLSQLMAPTKYSAARQQIEAWQREAHPLLSSFVEKLRGNEGKELDSLVAELSGQQADVAFGIFSRTYHAVTLNEFSAYGFGQPNEIYAAVARQLDGHGYSGILLVCDEFTEFLRRFEDAIDQQNREVDSETLAVQNLAETSDRSAESGLHFVVASLEGFASASARSSSGQASKAIERLGGRFRPYSLQSSDSEELIRGAIQRLPGIDQPQLLPNAQRDDLIMIAEKLYRPKNKNRQWIRDVVVDGAFPLHPLTTYALPLLNQQVAQSSRTMFLFLKDREGMQGFLQNEQLASAYPNWNNLLTVDRLYDYFAESILARQSNVSDSYAQALQQISAATIDTTTARRVLKVVAVCEVIAPQLSPTRELLRYALNLPLAAVDELDHALDLLEQMDAIVPPNDEQGSYALPGSGRINSMSLKRRITKQAQDLSTSVQRLQSAHPATAISAETYNRRRGSARELKAFYVGPNDLTNTTRLKSDLGQSRDALLWYVITSSETERSAAQSLARELTRDNKRLVIAVPTTQLRILEALREYEALTIVRSNPEFDGTARGYLVDNGRIGKGYYETLNTALSTLRNEREWEWFVGGASQPTVTSQSQVKELASKLMVDVFPYTPEQQLGQYFKVDSIVGSLDKAVDLILKGDIRLTKTSNAPETVILRKGAVELGLIKQERVDGANELYLLTEPSGNFNSKKVWQQFYDHLSAGKSWSKLVALLGQAPYGLYDSLLIVFAASFFTYHADSIEISLASGTGQTRIQAVDAPLLKSLVTKPAQYNVRMQPLNQHERQWLREVVKFGLKREFDPNGGRGTTLRARVADQVRSWVKRIQLPVFAEKLTVEQLQQFAPEHGLTVLNAVTSLLAANRNDFDLSSALIGTIPSAFNAPDDHSLWTAELVEIMVADFAEACRVVEYLPARLEEYASQRVAILFGCEHDPAEYRWGAINQWRAFRNVIPPERLTSSARNFFLHAKTPTGSIKTLFLEEFAKNTIGINTEYLRWPTLDSLDKLVHEIQKVKGEIDDKWKDLAPKEEVWLDGLSSAALGRPVADKSAEKAAARLADWSKAIMWPASAATMRPSDIQRLYPDLRAEQVSDIVQVLKRIDYDAASWQHEIVDALAKQFGVESWSKANVEQGVKRFDTALNRAANIDALLRRHTLHRLSASFAEETPSPVALRDTLTQWRANHPIPEQSDLSEEAVIFIQQIDTAAVTETMLLTTLPRAFPEIGQAYQQWPSYQLLDQYVALVERAVREINDYVPLTGLEYAWLSGMITEGLNRPLTTTTHDQRKLAQVVFAQLGAWLRNLGLPAFSAKLSQPELCELFPEATVFAKISACMQLLLRTPSADLREPSTLLLQTIPTSLGMTAPSESWTRTEVDELLASFRDVCTKLSHLHNALTHHLYRSIGMVFEIEANGDSAASLLAKLRVWRERHVLFPGEALSADATTVFNILHSVPDDPNAVLLTKLPNRLQEVRVAYDHWTTWSDRARYVQSLQAAAVEIKQRGEVVATPRARALWEHFQQEISDLSLDERRWLIRAFDQEFRA